MRLLGGEGEVEGSALDLAARFGKRFSLLRNDDLGQPLAILKDQPGQALEQFGALDRRQRFPCRLCPPSRGQRSIGIGFAAARHRSDDLLRCRILDLDPFLDGGVDPFTVDEMTVAVRTFDEFLHGLQSKNSCSPGGMGGRATPYDGSAASRHRDAPARQLSDAGILPPRAVTRARGTIDRSPGTVKKNVDNH